MHNIVPVEVMVLQVLERDDSSAVLVVFSKELGKLYVHAQGIRKLAAKHSTNMQVGSRVLIDIVRGKHEWRLVGSQLLAKIDLGSQAERVRFGKLSRVVLDLTAIEDPNEDVFSVLIAGAQSLGSTHSGIMREAKELALIVEALGWWVDDSEIIEYLEGAKSLRDFVTAVNKGLTEAYT